MTVGLAYLGPADYTEESLVARLEEERPRVVAIDTETPSLKDRRLIGIGIALNEREAVYFRVWPDPSPYLHLAWRLLQGPWRRVFHNGLYDLTVLMRYVEAGNLEHPMVQPLEEPQVVVGEASEDDLIGLFSPKTMSGGWRWLNLDAPIDDSSIMAHVQGLPSLELRELVRRYDGMEILAWEDLFAAGEGEGKKRKNSLEIPLADLAHKCMKDCLATYRLYKRFKGEEWWEADGHSWTYQPNLYSGFDPLEPSTYYVSPEMKDCYRVSMKLIPILLRMSSRGYKLRPAKVAEWYTRLSYEVLGYQDICDREGFNPGSPQQVGFILASRGNILPFNRHTKKLSISTKEEYLEELDDPLARVVLLWRKASKLRNTYLAPWAGLDKNGQQVVLPPARTYTHFRQDLSTGRLASYDRNWQNVPPPLREVIAADYGLWSWMDLSQVELRVFAYLTQDPVMLAAYEADDADLHWLTQSTLWPQSKQEDEAVRLLAKTFNFACIFDADAKTLSRHTKRPVQECQGHKDHWFYLYPNARPWMEMKAEEGLASGVAVTDYGRKMRLPGWELGIDHIRKCSINYPVQGTAFDIIARIMLRVEGMGIEQVLQVHDEILADGDYEFPKELEQTHPELRTPFKQKQETVWT